MKNSGHLFSELSPVDKDISGYGYTEAYSRKMNLDKTLHAMATNCIKGVISYSEPIVVKAENGEVYWQSSTDWIHRESPESFDTQFGVFPNHDHGEFTSWLGKPENSPETLSEKEREVHAAYGRDDYYIEGNYCDMFDCGKFTYAVSNLMHLGLGKFSVIRIDESLNHEEIFSSFSVEEHVHYALEYCGRIETDNGYYLIISGCSWPRGGQDKSKKITILLMIDVTGNCKTITTWPVSLSSPNSCAFDGKHLYFGQNKLVTRLGLDTGEISYYTNKSPEEIAELQTIW